MIATGSDKLRELLNNTFTPQFPFNNENISFDNLASVTGTRNTSLSVTGVPGNGYFNTVQLRYNRIDLSALAPNLVIYKEGLVTLEEISIFLNSTQDASIGVEDLVNNPIPVLNEGDSLTYTLVASPTSLGWLGSYDITLTWGKPQLVAVISSKELDTLKQPGDNQDYPSAWAFLYYQDFTSYRDALAIKNGTYADPLAVQSITSALGLPDWVTGAAVDLPTSAVANSNQNFDRVVVQQAIDANGLYGPIYFHYNTIKFDGG